MVPYAPTRIRTRPYHFIRALATAGHRLTVATVWNDAEERDTVQELETIGVRVLAERVHRARSAWNCLQALPTGDPLQSRYSWSPRLARRLAQIVREEPPDIVHVEHLRGARYGLALRASTEPNANRPAIVWDSVDCISGLFRRAARESRTLAVRIAATAELRRTERFEGWALSQFDHVVVTSAVDREELLQLAPRMPPVARPAPVDVVPNGVDLDYFSPPSDARDSMTLVITGKMSYHANEAAVVGFVDEIMPLVWTDVPSATLLIVGKDPSPAVLQLAERRASASGGNGSESAGRVRVTGTVPDLRPFLRRATLAVAPIQYGVGVQNKVLEALACGTPVVATPQAISALEVRSGDELIVTSSSQDLARTIVSLLRDPQRRARLAQAGREFVQRCHDWHAVASRLTSIYRDTRPH